MFVGCRKPAPPYNLIAQESGTSVLLIGLHALNDEVVWASGTDATIIRTINGGSVWDSFQHRMDSLQFRDIHGLSERNAIVLSVGEGELSGIYHFDYDSGWNQTYEMTHPDGFLDAMDFWDHRGIAYGDAIDSKPFILVTSDSGKSWQRLDPNSLPDAQKGEGGFASSGTCVETGEDGRVWIGTGAGAKARILFSDDYGLTWSVIPTDMVSGNSEGITSIRMDKKRGFITGGDLSKVETRTNNLFFTDSFGKVWYPARPSQTLGAFYGSAFKMIGDKAVVIVCGPKGADISMDMGQSWQKITPNNLWTADLLSSGTGWLMGKSGKILKIEITN
jgi:photosystem II stability/assembly factor-like uncharacterized protein